MNNAQLIAAAAKRGIHDLQIYQTHSKTASMSVYEHALDSFTISENDRWSIKGLVNGKMGRVSVEEFDEASIPFILDAIIENAAAITSSDDQELYAGDASYPEIKQTENTCLKASSAKKLALLQSLETKLLASDERIVQVMSLDYEDVEAGVSIENTKGLARSRNSDVSMLVASILVKEGEDQKSAYDLVSLKNLEQFDQDAFVHHLSQKALAKLHARQVISGSYPVLIEKEAMAELLRHVANQFHGENAAKGISMLKDSLNQKIFDEKITIIDDPLMEDGYESAAFDDEGVACRRKVMVDHGTLTMFFHNLKSAKLMQTTSTGNGFAQDIAPTNLYIEPGTTSYEEMIATMEKGVIITEVNGLHAGWNTVTTDFSLQAAGFYVENGAIQYPVNLITIAGNFLSLMKEISIIGNDLKFSYTGVGSPSILFPSIAISGE